MKEVIVDTDILSYILKQNPTVIKNFSNYLKTNEYVYISRITFVEILGGLKAKNAERQIQKFKEFISKHKILEINELSAEILSTIFAELWKKGKHSGNYDILIAGTAIANNLPLVTNNTADYENITGLELLNWTIEND